MFAGGALLWWSARHRMGILRWWSLPSSGCCLVDSSLIRRCLLKNFNTILIGHFLRSPDLSPPWTKWLTLNILSSSILHFCLIRSKLLLEMLGKVFQFPDGILFFSSSLSIFVYLQGSITRGTVSNFQHLFWCHVHQGTFGNYFYISAHEALHPFQTWSLLSHLVFLSFFSFFLKLWILWWLCCCTWQDFDNQSPFDISDKCSVSLSLHHFFYWA